MGTITEAQRKWLEGLGVNTAAAGVAPGAPTEALDAARGSEYDVPNADAAVPKKPFSINLNDPDRLRIMQQALAEQAVKDKKEAEQTLIRMNQALADVKAYVAGLPSDELARASYVTIMTEVRKRFPEVAGLSQWVKQTSVKVPDLKGKLPSAKSLMDVVQSTVKSRGGEIGWALSTGKNLATVNSDRLLAAYMSELPSGVSVKISGGVVQLSIEGAALSVATPAGQVDAAASKGGASVSLKNNDFTIQVSNDGWKDFDPELRGQWQKISDEASTVLKLKADRDKAKLELETKKKNGEEIKADLTADFDKREAELTSPGRSSRRRSRSRRKRPRRRSAPASPISRRTRTTRTASRRVSTPRWTSRPCRGS